MANTNWMKINWRGRVIFRDKEAIQAYYLRAFHRGRKAGYRLRLKQELKEKEDKQYITIKGLKEALQR